MGRSVEERINRKYGNSFYDLRQVLKILKNLEVTCKGGRPIFNRKDIRAVIVETYLFETTEGLLGPKYKIDKSLWVKREWLGDNFAAMGLYFPESQIEKAVKYLELNN